MDQALLVGDRVGDGLKFLEVLDEKLPVAVAFWAVEDEDERSWLYVASNAIDDGSLREGYRLIHNALEGVDSPAVDPFGIKLLPGDDPIARAAVAMQSGDLGSRRRLHRDCRLGSLYLSQLYIYPPLTKGS